MISFESQSVSVDEMKKRIRDVSSQYPWLVCEVEGKVMAYAYVNLWKARTAYKHTLETTVYVANNVLVKGIGTQLYQKLFEMLDRNEVHALMAVIALPNQASVALHEKMGFVEAGYFKEVGKKFDTWVDVAFYQKIL